MNELTPERLAEIKDYCAKESELNWLLHALRDRYRHDRKEREAASKELRAYRTDLPMLVAEVESLTNHTNNLEIAATNCSKQNDQLRSDLSAAQKRIGEITQAAYRLFDHYAPEHIDHMSETAIGSNLYNAIQGPPIDQFDAATRP